MEILSIILDVEVNAGIEGIGPAALSAPFQGESAGP
jgi:hypothetical protein